MKIFNSLMDDLYTEFSASAMKKYHSVQILFYR